MNTSMYTGVSGLIASQKGLDVESHNTSNVNTVAYKSDSISFYDMMYDKDGVGLGVSTANITKDFSQGNINNTDSPYDFVVVGDGFFTVESNNAQNQMSYTRAGNFQRGQDGFLVSSVGDYVLGNAPVITTVPQTTVVDNNIYTKFIASGGGVTTTSNYTINAYASNYESEAKIKGNLGITGDGLKTPETTINDINLLALKYQYTLNQNRSTIDIGDDVIYQKDTVKFQLPMNFDKSIEITIDGVKFQEAISTDAEQSFKKLADQVSATTGLSATIDYTTGIMSIASVIPGKDYTVNSAKNAMDNAIIINIQKSQGSGQKLISAFEEKLRSTITDIGGSFVTSKSEVTIPKPGDKFTQKIQLDLSNPILGISNASMGELFQEDGKLYIKQLNANYLVGHLGAVKFVNNSGLNPIGDNKYFKTAESGEPAYNEGVTTIKNNMLEISNTNLSESLVNLMVFQKAFEANSKSVTTSDELLKTALQLKAR